MSKHIEIKTAVRCSDPSELMGVNGAILAAGGFECGFAAISIDLDFKRALVAGSSYGSDSPPCVLISRGPEDKSMTEIEFPEFVGWTVFCQDVSRYTLSVCLIKRYLWSDE